jgi:hypothetical protein
MNRQSNGKRVGSGTIARLTQTHCPNLESGLAGAELARIRRNSQTKEGTTFTENGDLSKPRNDCLAERLADRSAYENICGLLAMYISGYGRDSRPRAHLLHGGNLQPKSVLCYGRWYTDQKEKRDKRDRSGYQPTYAHGPHLLSARIRSTTHDVVRRKMGGARRRLITPWFICEVFTPLSSWDRT